jgi:hypothetical protein
VHRHQSCPMGQTMTHISCWMTLVRWFAPARDRSGKDRPRDADRDLVEGQYNFLIRIVAFDTAEGWSRDVTMDIADELRRRYVEFGEVPDSITEFLETNRH